MPVVSTGRKLITHHYVKHSARKARVHTKSDKMRLIQPTDLGPDFLRAIMDCIGMAR